MGCCNQTGNKDNDGLNLDISTGGSIQGRHKKGESPVHFHPPVRYSEMQRLSTIDISLYSQFSEDGSEGMSDWEDEDIKIEKKGYCK